MVLLANEGLNLRNCGCRALLILECVGLNGILKIINHTRKKSFFFYRKIRNMILTAFLLNGILKIISPKNTQTYIQKKKKNLPKNKEFDLICIFI